MDYKIDDSTSIYFKSIYSNLQDYGDKWYYEPVCDRRPQVLHLKQAPRCFDHQLLLGGTKQFTASLLTWEVCRRHDPTNWIPPVIRKQIFPGSDPSWSAATIPPRRPAHRAAFRQRLRRARFSAPGGLQLGLQGHHDFQGPERAAQPERASPPIRRIIISGRTSGFSNSAARSATAHKYQNATENVYDGWKAANYPMTMFLSSFSSNNSSTTSISAVISARSRISISLQTYTLANLSTYRRRL